MPTMNHILFPFDFSEQGMQAAPFVRAIASAYTAKISVLTVIPPEWNTPPGERLPHAGLGAPEEEALMRQDRELARQFAGLSICRLSEPGDPALKIIHFAHSKHVDLIMMPTHGVSGYRTMLLGSVTLKVLHDAKCPVWTAVHAEEQQSQTSPRRILCAVDDALDEAGALMRWASEFSQRMGAQAAFLHVVPPVDGDREIQEEVNRAALDRLEEVKKSAWIPETLRVVAGNVAETIAQQARQERADLIVIGRGLLPSPVGRLRSNAYAIIQQSPCPVLSV